MDMDACFGKEMFVALKRFLNPFFLSAAGRLIIVICLFSILGSGIIMYVISYGEKNSLERQTIEFSSASSDLIKRSIRHLMLTRNPDALQNTIENLADNHNIKRIRIFDNKGLVAYSSKPKGINSFFKMDICSDCHTGLSGLSEVLPEKRNWRMQEEGKHKNLIFLDPVYNEPRCSAAECHFHPKGQRVLGVVETAFAISSIDDRSDKMVRNSIIFPLTFFCLLALFGGLSLLRSVRRVPLGCQRNTDNAGMNFKRSSGGHFADMSSRWSDPVQSSFWYKRGTIGFSDHPQKEESKRSGTESLLVGAAFDSIRDPFIILDRDFRIVKVNEAYSEMRGIPLTDLMNAKCYQVIYGNNEKCNDCVIEKTFCSGDPCAKDKLVKLKDRVEAWFEIYTYPIHDEQAKVSHAIEYLRDITDRKKNEKTMKSDYMELEQIFDGAADAMCVIDEKFSILRVNNMFLTLVGRTKENTIGQRCCDVFPGPECGSPNCCLTKMLRDTGPIIHFESQRNLDNGKGTHFIITATALRGPDGELIGIVEDFKDISERKKQENKLRCLSLQDELTGLCNRRGFLTLAVQELKVAARRRRSVVLLYSDLDGLKNINDSLGHEEGDRAIREVAAILKATFRTSDIIARLGGDEFVVIPTGTDAETVDTATRRLQDNVDLFNSRTDRKYEISLSTGVACYDPKFPCSINELLTRADALMYEDKRRRRD